MLEEVKLEEANYDFWNPHDPEVVGIFVICNLDGSVYQSALSYSHTIF